MDICTISAPSGLFRGLTEANAVFFRGITYAHAGRFERPVPAEFPDGVDCFAYGAKSVQNPQDMRGPVEGPFSEDCRSLNIVYPKENRTGKPLPVLFDIHGGAFQTGSGRDSGLFALVTEEDAQLMVVSINYRLGALGYLYLKDRLPGCEADGNLGMVDQLCALQWVRKNIASFGGDPGNITLHGVSAGGKSVGAMMLTPKAKPLFTKAILSSGGIMAVRTPETARILSQRYLDILGLADIKEILSCPVEKILEAQLEFAKSAGSTCLFGPVADGELIPLNWKEDIRSENGWMGNTLIGNNLHELMFFAFNPHLLETAPGIAAELFGDRSKYAEEAFAELAKDAADDKEKIDCWVKVFSDYMYRSHGDNLAQILAGRGGKVWTYSFDYPPAHHSQDAVTLHMGGKADSPFPDNAPDAKEVKDRMMKAMRSAFANFVITGDPNTSLLPAWGCTTPGHNERMHFDREFTFDDPESPSLGGFPDDVIHLG